jgi:N-acetylglucosaminyl-diphospho-decaprenol L-rhamnosyltransferase
MDLITELIQSIQHYVDTPYKLIIVNNSPDDSSIHELKSDLILIIDADQNLGFGVGCNLGIQYIYKQDNKALIWLINPDALLETQAVAYVEKCFSIEPAIAILGTKIKDTKGKMWFSSGNFNPYTGYIKHESVELNTDKSELGVTRSRWVCGCSLIINLARFEHCPSFDPNYFLYYEDIDLCERYYRKDYHIAITNHILVTHQVSSIIGKDQKNMYSHFTFSRLYLLQQHSTHLGLLIYLTYTLIKIGLLLPINLPIALGRWKGFKKFFTQLVSTKRQVKLNS